MTGKIKIQSVVPRIDGINRDLERLSKLANLSFNEFRNSQDNIALAQFYLRQALEGIFHIGAHILSRLNGSRSTEYKEIARNLGIKGVVDKNYAETTLTKMAGYRNRLTHFYAEITDKEIYRIISKDVSSLAIFLRYVKELLDKPSKFNLELE